MPNPSCSSSHTSSALTAPFIWFCLSCFTLLYCSSTYWCATFQSQKLQPWFVMCASLRALTSYECNLSYLKQSTAEHHKDIEKDNRMDAPCSLISMRRNRGKLHGRHNVTVRQTKALRPSPRSVAHATPNKLTRNEQSSTLNTRRGPMGSPPLHLRLLGTRHAELLHSPSHQAGKLLTCCHPSKKRAWVRTSHPCPTCVGLVEVSEWKSSTTSFRCAFMVAP